MTESLERRIRHDSTEDDLAEGDQPLQSDVPAGEDVDASREADDLDQDPDAVPNRAQEPEPPTSERVEPADPPREYDPLYDETLEESPNGS
jgi:hypothetical protein